MATDFDQLTGYTVETTTRTQIHTCTYCHNRISDLVACIVDKPMFQMSRIERIVITPKYAKKSTEAFERSEKCAKIGPETKIRCQAPTGKIITDQGIQITFGRKAKSFGCGPM